MFEPGTIVDGKAPCWIADRARVTDAPAGVDEIQQASARSSGRKDAQNGQVARPAATVVGRRRDAGWVAVDSNGDSNRPARGQLPAAGREQSPEVADADGPCRTKRAELTNERSLIDRYDVRAQTAEAPEERDANRACCDRSQRVCQSPIS
jgi:hypothetical protein